MNFLNPSVLFALAAASLPLIIHLLSIKRPKAVPFPSIAFLEKLKTDSIRRLRLKQLLLILLRTLIIILIVLAFARPAINSSYRKSARTSAVIVIDGSASMEYVYNGEVLFATAKRRAEEILDMLDDSDMAAIILAADMPISLGSLMTDDKKELKEALLKIENPLTGGNPGESFSLALKLLRDSADPNRELYYITDGADNAFPDSLTVTDDTCRLYTVMVGPEVRGGAVIESVDIAERLVTAGSPVTVNVRARLSSDDDIMNVELFVDNERKGRSSIEKGAGDTAEERFTYTPETPGLYSIYASVDDGRFEPGENRRLVLRVPEQASVLIAGGDYSDIYFIGKALDPDQEHAAFRIEKKLSAEIVQSDITLSDVIVLAGVSSLPVATYRSIVAAVVERGVGLIVFPPRFMDETLYANGIFRDMFPASVEQRVSVDKSKRNYSVIDWFDMNHAVLRGVSGGGAFQKPRVASYVKLQPESGVVSLARFGDGSLAIGDAVCGRGRVVMFAIDPSTEDSELPLSGIFTPLMIRTVQYLSGTGVLGSRYETGSSIEESVSGLTASESVYIKAAGAPLRSVETKLIDGRAVTVGETAVEPGFYSVYAGGVERARYSVDISAAENIFVRAGTKLLTEAYKGLKWKTFDSSERLSELVMNDRFGRELAGILFMLAFAAIFLEMILSRKV